MRWCGGWGGFGFGCVCCCCCGVCVCDVCIVVCVNVVGDEGVGLVGGERFKFFE